MLLASLLRLSCTDRFYYAGYLRFRAGRHRRGVRHPGHAALRTRSRCGSMPSDGLAVPRARHEARKNMFSK